MKAISPSLFVIISLFAGHAVVWGQTSSLSSSLIEPESAAHIESERQYVLGGHRALETELHIVESALENPDADRTYLPSVTIAISQSEVERRSAAVREVFGEPNRWIFQLEDETAADAFNANGHDIKFELDLTASVAQQKIFIAPPMPDIDDPTRPDSVEINTGFQWRQAINQSMILIGIQHGYALVAQEKTRRALKGPFFRDYWRSVKGLKGWDDGNRFFTNYIAHPMQGGLTGFIYVQNSPRAMQQQFGESKQYWKDRFTAFLWSTAWSTQWELGPISQSSIGNVGMYGGMGYVDLVITPTVGTGWLIAEEAIDRYVIRKLETSGDTVRKFSRMLLNPMRSVANLLRFKHPWYRDRPVGY